MVVYRYYLILLICLLALIPAGVSADSHFVEMSYVSYDKLGGDGLVPNCWCRLGQRLVVPDRIVTVIGYAVWRFGSPTGNITFSIYNATTDSLMVSKVWGDAGNLKEWGSSEGSSRQSVVLDEPIRINGEVKICVEYYGGNSTDYCGAGYYAGDMITGEYYTNYRYKCWHDIGEAEEGAYYYEYVDEWSDIYGKGFDRQWLGFLAIPIGVGVYFVRRRVKRNEITSKEA